MLNSLERECGREKEREREIERVKRGQGRGGENGVSERCNHRGTE